MRMQLAFVLVLVVSGTALATTAVAAPMADGIASATGLGAVDTAQARNRIQAKLLARRAAFVDAQRNLLEVVEGVRITSGTTVRDAQFESNIIANRVKYLVRNYFTISENTAEEEGIWLSEVTLGICINRATHECKNHPTLNDALYDQLERNAPIKRYTATPTSADASSGTAPQPRSGPMAEF